MADLIYRQQAIDTLNVGAEFLRRVLDDADIVGAERAKYEWGLGLIESYISDMKELPPAQPAQAEIIKDIRKWINSGNRGNADYFIVDKIEEIINKYE